MRCHASIIAQATCVFPVPGGPEAHRGLDTNQLKKDLRQNDSNKEHIATYPAQGLGDLSWRLSLLGAEPR